MILSSFAFGALQMSISRYWSSFGDVLRNTFSCRVQPCIENVAMTSSDAIQYVKYPPASKSMISSHIPEKGFITAILPQFSIQIHQSMCMRNAIRSFVPGKLLRQFVCHHREWKVLRDCLASSESRDLKITYFRLDSIFEAAVWKCNNSKQAWQVRIET